MVNMGGTSAAGAPDTAPADETDAALAGDSPGGERDLFVGREMFAVRDSMPN